MTANNIVIPTYLQMFFQLKWYCRRANYRNYSNKFCMASPEAVVQRCSVKKLLLKFAQHSQENTCVGAPIQMFSYEFCKIFKNTYFEEHLCTTASVSQIIHSSKQHYRTCFPVELNINIKRKKFNLKLRSSFFLKVLNLN